MIGPNGAGKTTLFRMIAGEEQPDAGTLRLGDTVQLAYVDQSRGDLDPKNTVWKEISGGHDMIELGKREVNSRQYTSWFNFRGGDQQKPVGQLSGGERNRVHLAKLLKSGGNVLLLDEPTNDLDVDTLRALEEALLDFAGCAVVITHDRWFLDRVATHILAFEGDSRGDLVRGHLGRVRRLGHRDEGRRSARAAPHQVQAARPRREAPPQQRANARSSSLGYAAIAFAYFGVPAPPAPGARPRRLRARPARSSSGRSRGGCTRSRRARTRSSATRSTRPAGSTSPGRRPSPGSRCSSRRSRRSSGPAVSYNLAAVLLPAAAAFTAYLLCRHLTRSTWASLVGGYLFGFSSYMLGQSQGHMHMTSVFLLPLIALATIRYLQGELDGRGFAWRLGLLFGLEVWLSTELLFTAALVLALALDPGLRPARSRRGRGSCAMWRPLLGAIGLAVVLAAPFLYYAVTGFQSDSINAPAMFDADSLNFLIPTHFIWIGGQWLFSISQHFRGNDSEAGSYLGIPTLVIVVWFAFGARRSAVARYLLVALAVAAILMLGTGFVVKGHVEFWLPYREIASLPIFNNVLPARFAVYASLAAGVIVALWTAARHDWVRWVLPALAVAALVPDMSRGWFVTHPERLAFFTSGAYKLCIKKNENVAIFPFGFRGDSTLWQAETGFWFRMPEGYLAPSPPASDIDDDPLIQMETYTYDNPTPAQIIRFVHQEKVDRIVSVITNANPNGTQMHRFGQLQVVDDVYVAPGCGYASMQEVIQPSPPHLKKH